ncbi:MAG: MBL fold metallo-hydrolase [Streptomyces sp.]
MRSHRPDVSAHGTTDSCRLRPQWSENLRHRTRQSIGALLIEHGERALLIDAGFGPRTLEAEPGSPIGALHGGEPLDNLARVGRRPEDIEAVAITHLHGDTSAGCWWLRGSGLSQVPGASHGRSQSLIAPAVTVPWGRSHQR